MDEPVVSVIIPVYNASKYLDECLDSLVKQTFTNIEIICVNDASTDDSLNILQKWAKKDERIKIINSLQNRNVGGARNLGIKAAKGSYIGFIDSDDFVSPNLYKALVDASQMEAEAVTLNLYTEYGKNSILIRNFKNDVDFNNQNEIKRNIIAFGCRMWTSIFKRTFLFENQLFFPENMYFEDNPIVHCAFLLANRVVVVNNQEPLYFYRINPTSIVHGFFSEVKLAHRLETSKMMLDNFKKYKLPECYKEEMDFRFYKLFYHNSIALLLYRSDFESKKVKHVYSEYLRIVGDFPNNAYMREIHHFHLFKMIGKYPIIGKLLRNRYFNLIKRCVSSNVDIYMSIKPQNL